MRCSRKIRNQSQSKGSILVLHKTEEDELNEAQVAVVLEQLLGTTVLLTDVVSTQAAYDLIVSDANKEPIAYIEVKRRHITHDKYDTAIAGKNKTDKMVSICAERGVKGFYVFWYDDGMYFVSIEDVLGGELGRVTRRKPRASGKWSKSDWGHDGYYFSTDKLLPIKSIKEVLASVL